MCSSVKPMVRELLKFVFPYESPNGLRPVGHSWWKWKQSLFSPLHQRLTGLSRTRKSYPFFTDIPPFPVSFSFFDKRQSDACKKQRSFHSSAPKSSCLQTDNKLKSYCFAVMDHFDGSFRNQIAAVLRVINVAKSFKEDKTPCQIEEGLFLGSFAAANNKDALKRMNITHVLTVANSLAPAYPNDFVYKIIGVADREETNLKQYFDECFNFIEEAKRQGGGVLVHCFVGRSRSVTIVVSYLMKKHGMTLSRALERVKSRRPQAAPNAGFIAQLLEFEKSIRGIPLPQSN